MTCFKDSHGDQIGIWLLHAATMTASHFHGSEVAMWQLLAAALIVTHGGFPIGVKQGFRKQRRGYGSSVDFRASADLPRTFRGASAKLPATPRARICFLDNLQEWSQGPRRHVPESILVASFRASRL